jgi:hypothetical protein
MVFILTYDFFFSQKSNILVREQLISNKHKRMQDLIVIIY